MHTTHSLKSLTKVKKYRSTTNKTKEGFETTDKYQADNVKPTEKPKKRLETKNQNQEFGLNPTDKTY